MTTPTWRNRKIAEESHSPILDSESEKGSEDQAYNNYKESQHREAAAHHLYQSHKMMATGKPQEANKHRTMYELHLAQLGLKANTRVEPKIASLMKTPKEDYEFFTHHPADRMI